jgi:hypothetical protein
VPPVEWNYTCPLATHVVNDVNSLKTFGIQVSAMMWQHCMSVYGRPTQ